MIILDTNVLSALMRSTPDPAIVAWLDTWPAESIWLTSITVFESRLGLALLPRGRRQRTLEERFERLLVDDLRGRVLPFDSDAAAQAAVIGAQRQRGGRMVDMRDTQIAGVAVCRRATIATRNVRHFDDLPTPVVNPWAVVG